MGANLGPAGHVIIGMGAAGLAAALSIRQCESKANITLITDDSYGYYSRPGLAYLLAGEVPDRQLFPFPDKLFRDQHFHVIQAVVESIDVENRQLVLQDRRRLSYSSLLIATGASAVIPNVPGIQAEGVVKLDNLSDAHHILKQARKARRAVVIGGGITALELVEGLLAQGIETHYFLRGDRYWSSVLDEVESRIVESRLSMEGVKIHYFTDLLGVREKKGKVIGVTAQQQGLQVSIDCQLVAVAIGIKPRMQLAEAAGIATKRGILVDTMLQTSAPDIYAAGDVAQVYDRQKGDYFLDSLWHPAIQMGRVAGANMAGGKLNYIKKYPLNVTRLAGLVTTIIGRVGKEDTNSSTRPARDADTVGIMRGDSEVWRLQPEAELVQTYQGDNRLRLYINQNRVVGAVLMGDQALSHAIQGLIQEEIDIQPIRDALMASNADLPSILSRYWSARTHAAKVA